MLAAAVGLQIKKRLRKVRCPAQRHTASQWWSRDILPGIIHVYLW